MQLSILETVMLLTTNQRISLLIKSSLEEKGGIHKSNEDRGYKTFDR